MRSTCRDRLQGLHHHPLHVVVPNRAWRSRSRLVHQTITAGAQKPPPPLADGTTGGAQFAGYLQVALAGGRLQHDARPQDQRLSSRGPSHPALQLLPLSLRQIWNLSRVVVRHSRSPPQGRPTMAPLHLLVKHFSDGTLAPAQSLPVRPAPRTTSGTAQPTSRTPGSPATPARRRAPADSAADYSVTRPRPPAGWYD